MREIKFRAWDCGVMHYDGEYRRGHSLGYVLSRWETNLMQYTGLKDKNGVEIYEGDVLMWKDILVKVVWENQASAFWMIWRRVNKDGKIINHFQEMNATYGDGNNYLIENAEVVGNIYENSELIKQP